MWTYDPDFINSSFPVTGLLVYPNDCYKVVRDRRLKTQMIRGKRERIKMFTKRSRENLCFTINATQVEFYAMLTLTYPRLFPTDGKIVKGDLDVVLKRVRRLGWEYLWLLEFQERGAPHIHLLLSVKGVSTHMRADWGLYWTHRVAMSDWFRKLCGLENFYSEVIKMARFNCHEKTFERLLDRDKARWYVMSYAAKARQKVIPEYYQNVGRWWGCSRNVRPKAVTAVPMTEEKMRRWLRANGHPAYKWEIIPKNLWGVQT